MQLNHNGFRTPLGWEIFKARYQQFHDETWKQRAKTIVRDVCGQRNGKRTIQSHPLMSADELHDLEHFIANFMFVPAGRYIYYAGRPASFYQNCHIYIAEHDTREEWGRLLHSASDALMSGAGIGIDYSVFRPHGAPLARTGGTACLTADTVVYKDRKKSRKNNEVTIGRLFELQETKPEKFSHIKIRSLDESSGLFYRNQLLGVIYNGEAEVFEVTTESGYTIKATLNHRFMNSSREYQELGEFVTGDQIAVNGTVIWTAPDPNSRYRRYACTECGSAVSRKDALCANCRENRPCPQCGGRRNRKAKVCFNCATLNQQQVDANETTARQRRECIAARKDFCEVCGTVDGKFEVHHKDKNPLNNKPENLINVCIACHNAIHMMERRFGNPYGHRHVSFDRIVSIRLVGIESVYDLQMEGPNHNFVANGFVSHNSGPIPLMQSINEVGRNVRQGGARRSAIYASLNWQHGDVEAFLKVKDWRNTPVPGASHLTFADLKEGDFDAAAPLDSTNISLNYDDAWLYHPDREQQSTFVANVRMAMHNGEPGFSFNFGTKQSETGRNACCEATSSDDSDICNLGSVNLAAIPDLATLKRVVELGSKFLICGSIRGDMPDEKTLAVREKNRRIGLGLMGVHEWLLKRSYRYGMNDELRQWMQVYQDESTRAANEHCDRFYISRPVACRAIAPTGTIGLLTGTTTGLEPIYAVAYKRRWIDGDSRKYQLVVDQTAADLIQELGIEDPDRIETAIDLAADPERRIAFQADMQDYVDMAISSTLNIPAWGTDLNNESRVQRMADIIAHYAPRLRGLTFYPDGARGGQPLVKVPYAEAKASGSAVFEEHSDVACKSGVCGV